MVTIITLDNLADYDATQVYNLEADSRLIDSLGTVNKMLAFIATNPKVKDVKLRLNRNAYKVNPARWD